MQINQGSVFGCAAARLVQPLAVKAERGAGRGKQLCRRKKVFFGNAADLRHQVGRAVTHGGFQRLKAAGVGGNVGRVQPAFPQHEVQHAVEQHHVGAGLNG